MDRKTGGIIATVVSTLLCGCPGLASMCVGLITAATGFSPDATTSDLSPETFWLSGGVLLCLGVIFVIIPVVVGFFALRGREPETVVDINEPLPPAI